MVLFSFLKCRRSRCYSEVMTHRQKLENVKRLAQIRNRAGWPYFSVHQSLVLRAVSIIGLVIVETVRLPLRRLHLHVTRHRRSLSGRRSRSHARTIDPLPKADQAILAAWHSLSLIDCSFKWGRQSVPSWPLGWASRISGSWGVYILIGARVSS